VLQKLYVAVAEARDRDRRDGDAGSFLTPGEREAIDDFLDAWES